jgi:hypothetical protein
MHFTRYSKKFLTMHLSVFLLSGLLSCGMPSAGCGDGVVCIENPANQNLATENDVVSGKVAYSASGERLIGSLSLSRMLSSGALRSKTSDLSKISTQLDDASGNLSDIYLAGPTLLNDSSADSSSVDVADVSSLVACGHPSVPASPSIEDRIEDCKIKNTATAIVWNGKIRAKSTEGLWTLVVRTADGKNLWRDDTSGLLWSDDLGVTNNWCKAAGNSESSSACASGGSLQAATPESFCSELTGFDTPPELANAKGNLSGSEGIQWRLPTKSEWLQAELNGVRWVIDAIDPLSYSTRTYWSSTIFGLAHTGTAWTFNSWGEFSVEVDNIPLVTDNRVICVGTLVQKGFSP